MDELLSAHARAGSSLWGKEMNPQSSIPIVFAVAGFLILFDSRPAANQILRAEYGWQKADSIRKRLAELGKDGESHYENFRVAQMGLVSIFLLLLLALFFLSAISFSALLGFFICGSTSIIYLTERNLDQRVLRHRKAIENEFPAILEILMLAITAGESPAAAFRRVSSRSHGTFANKLKSLVREIERGTSLTMALDALSKDVHSEQVRRFVDAVVIATARGTSLTETFHHAVEDSRNSTRAQLITAAGKSEISMLIPVVFLILPISIVFALFPSISNLNLFTP